MTKIATMNLKMNSDVKNSCQDEFCDVWLQPTCEEDIVFLFYLPALIMSIYQQMSVTLCCTCEHVRIYIRYGLSHKGFMLTFLRSASIAEHHVYAVYV
jgi:hypothetical protein